MRICIIGAGYVGLVTSSCFAELGHNVICVDRSHEIINKLNDGIVPIYEPGLEHLIQKNMNAGRLRFTTNIREAIQSSFFIFIAVGTPSLADGSADLSAVLNVAEQIGASLNTYSIIITKSTVPIGTSEKVRSIIRKAVNKRGVDQVEFDVVSNPEFLREGKAIDDFLNPNRIIIGSDNDFAANYMKELYSSLTSKGHPLLVMDIPSAELTKYAANAMLAARISFINEIAAISAETGADIQKVQQGVGLDQRIGPYFLAAGIGYGGSCFPKDIRSLIRTAADLNISTPLLESVEKVNFNQKRKLFDMIVDHFGGTNLSKYTFAVWGLAFKPDTDDIRNAPSLDIIHLLTKHGATVFACDPVAIENTHQLLGNESIQYFKNPYDAVSCADALIICTEWQQFKLADLERVKHKLKQPIIFDGRNIYDPKMMINAGFTYKSIGRNA